MPELVITLTDGRVNRRTLGPKPVVLGREATCDIHIDDRSTSRQHARIVPVDNGYILEDLGSKNGTLVNDVACSKTTPLRSGDRILMGSVLVVYHDQPVSTPSVVLSDDANASRATRYVPQEQRLTLSQRRLEMIYELTDRLTTLQDKDALLENAMNICCEMLAFERGAIGVRRRNQRVLDWPVVRNLRGTEGELTISRTLLTRALEHGERAIFAAGQTTDPTVSMVQHGIRSAMCVPLVQGEGTIGVIYGDRTSTSQAYAAEDIDFFAAIARQISIGLINAQLLEDQKQMVALQHDLDLARNIQNGLFPRTLPGTSELRVAALNDPGRRISGDYYDVIERPDGRVWCLIADVTGEGAPAAIQMANLQAVVRATIDQSDDPGAHLSKWNDFICRQTHKSRIITCLLALIDPKARTITSACAGHWPPILVDEAAGSISEVQVNAGFPLGVAEDTPYPSTVTSLPAAACLFFCYTDGVIEAWNLQGESFGLERLQVALRQKGEINPSALVKQIRKQVSSFVGGAEQSDDITILAARIA